MGPNWGPLDQKSGHFWTQKMGQNPRISPINHENGVFFFGPLLKKCARPGTINDPKMTPFCLVPGPRVKRGF